jgi:prolyl-tRNA editing enzyme YbaK/EbsC (Cys-tRNA(Pro) deacylase)
VQPWPEPVERVAAAFRTAGVDARIEELAAGTATAAAAAQAVGCELAQIVKTLVFRCDDSYVLALVPGDRKADERRVAEVAGAGSARIATGSEVLAATGFEPGGVSPVPPSDESRALLDRRLLVHGLVWIGAGSPRHVAGLAPGDLARAARAEAADLSA